MKQHIHFLITTHFLIATACTAMEEDITIRKPRFCLFTFNEAVIVAGENDWNFFDTRSKQTYHEIRNRKVEDVTMSTEIIALAIKKPHTKKHHLCICSKHKNGTKLEHIFKFPSSTYSIVANNHIVFSYHKGKIQFYDYRDKRSYQCKVPYDTTATKFPYVSCHPTKTEFLYPSSKSTLSIVQPYNDTFIKMNLETDLFQCEGGEYNPNGTMLAMRANLWQYFIYNLEGNDSYAYEIGTHQIYISSTFHPHLYILFLLSEDNIIEGWDYLRRILLFTIYPVHDKYARMDTQYNKRLACSPDGTQLLVALEDEWKIIDIPHKNDLLSIDTSEFFQFNLIEFFNVKKLPPMRGGVDLSKEAVVPTEYRKITAVYHKK